MPQNQHACLFVVVREEEVVMFVIHRVAQPRLQDERVEVSSCDLSCLHGSGSTILGCPYRPRGTSPPILRERLKRTD